jgi:Ca2+-binding EF-hand superfamily protein
MSRKTITSVKFEKVLAIPEEKRQEYKEAFDMFDHDGSGIISVDEIYRVMKNMGNEMSMDEIKFMISDLDHDGSGTIDFEEFITFMQRTQVSEEISEEEEVIRAFQSFDKDGNGWLSCDEFRHILCNLGDKFSEEEVLEIFKEADLNNDGKIEYREFVDFWKNK